MRMGNRLRVVEVQYKKPTEIYRYVTPEGAYIETFSKATALKNAAKKDSQGERIPKDEQVIETQGSRIYYGFFCGDILLEHAPLAVQPTNTSDFTYIPVVYDRRRNDGVPVGLVYEALDAQREANKRRSKTLHLLNTQGIIADSEAAIAMGGKEAVRQEMARP